jgi:hypothetical protein
VGRDAVGTAIGVPMPQSGRPSGRGTS